MWNMDDSESRIESDEKWAENCKIISQVIFVLLILVFILRLS